MRDERDFGWGIARYNKGDNDYIYAVLSCFSDKVLNWYFGGKITFTQEEING